MKTMQCSKCKLERLTPENFEALKLLMQVEESHIDHVHTQYCECPGSIRPPKPFPSNTGKSIHKKGEAIARLRLEQSMGTPIHETPRPKLLSESKPRKPPIKPAISMARVTPVKPPVMTPPPIEAIRMPAILRKSSDPTMITPTDIARAAVWKSQSPDDLVNKIIRASIQAISKRPPNAVLVLSQDCLPCHHCGDQFSPYADGIRCGCFYIPGVEELTDAHAAMKHLTDELMPLVHRVSKDLSMACDYDLSLRIRSRRVIYLQASIVIAEALHVPLTHVLDKDFKERAHALIGMLSRI